MRLKLLTVVSLCVVLALGYSSLRDVTFRTRSFIPSAWRGGDCRIRGEMVDSLQARNVLGGKTREEVLALLGTPDDNGSGSSIGYRIDVGKRFSWRPCLEKLVVQLDQNNRVRSVARIN